ncbi:MAG: hypothetical protein K0R00_56 [Herbinix sp.]|jgi:hypothetical protein|nr:hypothetical protein [Herbinix sp.]
MDKRLRNISNAFGASLSFGFEKEARDYSLSKEDLAIKKYAGIDIYQPTADNIETFIRKYVLNELAFFPSTPNVAIQLNPEEMDKAHSDYVSDANGVVAIKYFGKVIELPFMVIDGELIPFDVIQSEGTRVPYSRENMKKVVYAIQQLQEKDRQNNTDDPYVGLDTRNNPATSTGFLGNVLQIRDQAVGHSSPSGQNYIYAAEKIDELLEKAATIKEFTEADLKVLNQEFERKASEEVKLEMEKMAAEINVPDDQEKLKLFEKAKNLQYDDAIKLPNGTVIAFPEKNGNEISMTNGIVVDNFMSFADKAPKKVKLVITADARVKILSNSERFLCLKAPETKFSIKMESLSTLQEGDIFMAFDGDKALFPSKVNWINERTYGSGDRKNDISTKSYELSPIYDNSEIANLLTTSETQNILNVNIRVNLCTLDGAKFFEMPYGDFIAKKSKELAMDEFKLSNLMSKGSICINYHKVDKNPYATQGPARTETNLVLATDPETRVILIKGIIKDYLQNKEDLDKLAYVESYEDTFEKVAAVEKNKIKIVCRDKQLGAYDVEINYVDTKKAILKRFVKTYTRISKDDLKLVLKLLGFNQAEFQEIIFKVNNNPQMTYALPANPNIEALQGARVQSLAGKKIQNTVKSMVKPKELAGVLATSVIASMLSDGLSGAPSAVKDIAAQLGNVASEGKTLSSVFEKIALERESQSALEVAKIMSLSSFFAEKVASTANETHNYPRIYEVSKDIIENRDILERVACDLMQLKVMQYKNRNQVVSPNYIQAAIEQIDHLHKVAYDVCSAKYDMTEIMEKEAGFVLPGAIVGGAIGGLKTSKENDRDKTLKGVAKGALAGAGIGLGANLASSALGAKVVQKASEQGTQKFEAAKAKMQEEFKNHVEKQSFEATDESAEKEAGAGLIPFSAGVGTVLGGIEGKKKESEENPKAVLKGAVKGGLLGASAGAVGNIVTSLPALVKDVAKSKAVKHASEELDELAKEASALSGAAIGGLMGSGAAYQKSVDQAKEVNPTALPSDYGSEAASNAIAGGAAGVGIGALAGAGVKAIKNAVKNVKVSKLASEELDELFKEAEMNVPTKEEAKKESNVVPEEPTIDPKTGLKDINCEVCSYKGQPDNLGYCPECGALGGITPKEISNVTEMSAPSHDLGGEIYSESAQSFEE